MDSYIKIPFYARTALIFIGIFAFVYTLYIGQRIIVPIVYATIIAILLNPLVNYLLQKIDNHYIIPRIVASRVKINALISIIVVLIGGTLWGIPGMFLSIPLVAIIKVIFDHIEPLKPWGYLLGNTVPSATKYSFIKNPKPLSQTR